MYALIDACHTAMIDNIGWPYWSQQCCIRTTGASLLGYRMTTDDYRRIRDAQGGVCAICGQCNMYAGEVAPLNVDHDHVCCRSRWSTCGQCVRGLLCAGCNGFLGMLELWGPTGLPNAEWDTKAIAYLRRYECDHTAPQRQQRLVDEHQQKVAGWPKPCSCRHCATPG